VTFHEGMKDRKQLIKVWSTFSAADEVHCEASAGGRAIPILRTVSKSRERCGLARERQIAVALANCTRPRNRTNGNGLTP
jgi:hypothetical protein